jgi:hypothetical protein
MLKTKIIHYWQKNPDAKYSEIADYFNTKIDFVIDTIEEYKKEPYIIRESIMNYE